MEYQSAERWSLRQFYTRSIINLKSWAQTDVGRNKQSNLRLKWVFLSQRHAAFVVNIYGNLLLRDLKSTSGTFVNGQALPTCKNRVLAHGDIVSFGLGHYVDATTIPMKLCFFEVIAGDGGSTMGTLLKGTGKKQPLDAAEPEPIPNTSKVNEESIDSVIDSSTTRSEGSTSSKGQEKAIQNIQPTRVFDPMISNTDKNQLIYSRLQSAGNSSVEAVSETDDFSRWVDGCIGKIDINMDNLSLAQFEMPQTSNATIYTHDDSDETEIPSTSQEIINTPSTSKMLVSKEESSSKAKSPPTDESALLCEQNRSGTKITILRKTKIRTERVNLFKMEDAEKEHIKAIRRKRLEELVQKKKGNKKSIPLQNSFEVYVRAELDDELFNKSDKDDNGDE